MHLTRRQYERLQRLRRSQRAKDRELSSILCPPQQDDAYVHDNLLRTHVFHSSFSSSALAMAFAEGERNTGLQLLNDIMQFAPDQYVQMMREANDRRIADEPRRGGTNGRGDDSRSEPDSAAVASDYEPTDAALDD